MGTTQGAVGMQNGDPLRLGWTTTCPPQPRATVPSQDC